MAARGEPGGVVLVASIPALRAGSGGRVVRLHALQSAGWSASAITVRGAETSEIIHGDAAIPGEESMGLTGDLHGAASSLAETRLKRKEVRRGCSFIIAADSNTFPSTPRTSLRRRIHFTPLFTVGQRTPVADLPRFQQTRGTPLQLLLYQCVPCVPVGFSSPLEATGSH